MLELRGCYHMPQMLDVEMQYFKFVLLHFSLLRGEHSSLQHHSFGFQSVAGPWKAVEP